MNLQAKSWALRKQILNMIYRAKAGHIGGDFSVCDMLNILYNQQMNVSPDNWADPNRDRFIMSKGHCVEALYSVLCDKGFLDEAELLTFSQFGSRLIGHPNNQIPGIEMNSGSLGHGLSVATGMALAARLDNAPYRVYTIMGDGELAEGSVWEGAMLAGHYGLDNLIALVDRNGLQISGSTEDVMKHGDLAARFASFGWNVLDANGNDLTDLEAKLNEAKGAKGKPTVIIARTVKGCGVSFMENQAGWHHRVPTPEEYEQAMAELTQKEQEASA